MQNLMARLKSKRFRQIFEYLDQDQDGLLDLAELLSGGLAARLKAGPHDRLPCVNTPAAAAVAILGGRNKASGPQRIGGLLQWADCPVHMR